MRPSSADSFMAGNKVTSGAVDVDDNQEDDAIVDVVSLSRKGLGQSAQVLDFCRILSSIGQANELLQFGKLEPGEGEEVWCRHVGDPVAAGSVLLCQPPDDDQVESEVQRINRESMMYYAAFRKNMLHQFAVARQRRHHQGYHLLDDGAAGQTSPNSKDPGTYQLRLTGGGCFVERRKKNNQAAKRSRDARRAKEDEVTIRAAFLEQENVQLRWEVAKLAADTADMARASLAAEAEEALAPTPRDQKAVALGGSI